jgi:integrase
MGQDMPRIVSNNLSAVKVTAIIRAAKPGYNSDGAGLFLQVSRYGSASWVWRYRAGGRVREYGLGSAKVIGLADARQLAAELRKKVILGEDPVETREERRRAVRTTAAKAMTFAQCAAAYIRAHAATWKNAKHGAQWDSTLESYVYPHFGSLPVASIDTALVMKAVEPIWTTKPETASRVRGRIESILGWAKTSGYRDGDNPAQWRGHLENLLPAPTKAKAAARRTTGRAEHHAALPYADLGAFMVELRQQQGVAARALEFAILTAARTGDVIGATWGELNLAEKVWTVPAARMKAGKEHRVPLSSPALDILAQMAALAPQVNGNPDPTAPVFPGARPGQPLSNMALLMTLRRMGRGDLTAHGFRSTFRDWAAERTNFPAEVAEMALAHTVGDKVEAAYRRGDLFQKRRQIMDAWAKYCAAPPAAAGGSVVELRRQGRRA